MSFQTTLDQHFPNAISEIKFVTQSSEWLYGLGFSAENSIASLSRCRDELTMPLLQKLRATWGELFDLSALAGMIFAGKTGFSAAIGHAPTMFERHRYLFFAFTHIGIAEDGTIGKHLRDGQDQPTLTCGALSALLADLQKGDLDTTIDAADLEQSLLRRRLAPAASQSSPDLVTLTKLAEQAISADLQQMIDLTVDSSKADYGVITGIQIHAAQQRNFISLATAHAVVNGVTHHL